MVPIFNSTGAAVAWFKDDVIFSLKGAPLAFLRGEDVVNYTSGIYCGFLKNGFFRDHSGDIAAFLKGATGGPMLPVTKTPEITPIAGVLPIKPVVPMAPIQPHLSLKWSAIPWDQYISAQVKPAPPRPAA